MRALVMGAAAVVWPMCGLADCLIDGNDTAMITTGNFAATPSQSVALTTASGNDVIIIHSVANVRGNEAVSVAAVSGGGLTFHLRFKETQDLPDCRGVGSPCYFDVETWWATAPLTLSGTPFTVTYNAPVQAAFANIHAFGVSGLANTASPWDSNGSLPAKATNYGGAATVMEVAGVSTSNAKDFLIYTCFANLVTGSFVGSNCSWANTPGQLPTVWSPINALYQQNIFTGFFNNSSTYNLPVTTNLASATLTAQNPAVAIKNLWISSADALVCVASVAASSVSHVWVHE